MHIAPRLKKEYSYIFSPPLGLQEPFYKDLYFYFYLYLYLYLCLYLYTTSSSINTEHLVN